MSSRVALPRWTRPSQRTLEGKYPSGRPPFDLFPTVTNLISAIFCPVAIYHQLLHGIDRDVTSSPSWKLQGTGELYHRFIASLKTSMARGEVSLRGVETIRHEFISFARVADHTWSLYLEPWSYRKFDELKSIELGSELFFEIAAANTRVQFVYDRGTRTYPLTGIIDEIDFGHRRIVERTIKGNSDDDKPPHLKDYQVWLLWKILCSIEKTKYPNQWKTSDIVDFDLVVETPYKDFPVAKDNPEFEGRVHEAYAWIHDLSFDKKAEWEVYKHKSCTYGERARECGLKGFCYRSKQPYPTTRSEMRRAFKDMYRPLLWEQMWNRHLFQYRLLMLPSSALEQMGLVSKGKIVSFKEGKIEVEVPKDQISPIAAHRLEQSSYYMVLPFGTFFLGKTIQARLKRMFESKLVFEVSQKDIPVSENVLILPGKTDLSIVEARPWYLTRLIQKDMSALEYVGTNDPERASNDSVVQLIEGLFGKKAIRRESSD